ncbi:MAG: gluconate 2-dehydrogenase subunit 3 family protein [Xanthomonadales bacterium]|nr:gluconate 2-dehydrogenase subunit 3 family protein [Xanthomonadales bacterium]
MNRPLDVWRRGLVSRRRFLIAAAGGTVALLFAQQGGANADSDRPVDPWPILEATLEHMLPTEPESPGAKEIHALDYLRFVVADPRIDAEERDFLLQGSRWLDELARQRTKKTFIELGFDDREALLRQITRSAAGENWVSTLLSYLLEALLTAPAYGGNTDGIGWRWLEYVPGFPLPGPGTRYAELPL